MQLQGRVRVIKNILAKGFRQLEKVQLNVQLRPLILEVRVRESFLCVKCLQYFLYYAIFSAGSWME